VTNPSIIIKAVLLGGPMDGTRCEVTDRPRYEVAQGARMYSRGESVSADDISPTIGAYVKTSRTRSGRAIYLWSVE
jgi:hypothetical protein